MKAFYRVMRSDAFWYEDCPSLLSAVRLARAVTRENYRNQTAATVCRFDDGESCGVLVFRCINRNGRAIAVNV